MGVIIKYLVDLPDLGFAASTDPFASKVKFLLDATVICKMTRGTANSGSSFEIRLNNLPKKEAKNLYKRIVDKTPTTTTIKMGYADGGPYDTVMEGLIDNVRLTVDGDNLVTTITGKEYATHLLQRAEFQVDAKPDSKVSDVIKKLVSDIKLPEGEKKPSDPDIDPSVTNTMGSHNVRGANVMAELDQLAKLGDAELLVVDNQILVGNPVKVKYKGKDEVPAFDPLKNLVNFEPFTKKLPGDNDRNLLALEKPESKKADAIEGFTFLVLGDPLLRPGQQVSAKADALSGTDSIFRIHSLAHKLSPEGYVCQGEAVKVNEKDANVHRKSRAAQQPTAESLIDNLSLLTKETRAQSPSIEIGKVKEYSAPDAGSDKHRATLFYGQKQENTETQPSINVDVEAKDNQIADKKPIISPFAWHKCGLMVPVYKGMKAVIAHNKSLADDSLVAGFIWSQTPAIEPPASKAGDWWLCLPADYDDSNPPSDSTKAANDLTANNGKRVIEVKGLKITVGADKLGNVGARPTEGADNVFLIEHKSGTKFEIGDDGTLTISASTLSIKGDVTIEGNVEIK